MKYLKSYKLFEDISIDLDISDFYQLNRVGKKRIKERFNTEFINTLRDFCLDLNDSDHDIKIHLAQYAKNENDGKLIYCCCVDITSAEYNDYIDWDKLEIVIQEIQSYVSDFGFEVDIEIVNDNEFESADDFLTSGIEEYSAICILIY